MNQFQEQEVGKKQSTDTLINLKNFAEVLEK